MKTFLFATLALLCTISSCAQKQSAVVKSLGDDLSNKKINISQVLTDKAYMSLHPQTEFRKIIKEYATTGPVSITTKDEAGARMTVKGIIKDKSGAIKKNLLVYFYQTDNKGLYADTTAHVGGNSGDRNHARLFGYLRTGSDGSFEIHTIHPQGYPDSDLPQHIHFECFDDGGKSLLITEFLFDDDKRLTESVRQRYHGFGAIIAVNKGGAGEEVYNYEVVVR